MRAISQTSPYVRKETSTKRMMIDVLIALIPVVAFAVYQYQLAFVNRMLLASLLAVSSEAVSFILMKNKNETISQRLEKYTVNNVVPPIITAIILVLTLPSTIPYLALSLGTVFAIVIGKMIFGGLGRNIFNPAGLGRVFIGLSFASLFVYTNVDDITGVTALGQSFPEVLNSYSLLDLFFGNVPGSMGEVSALAILIGAIYLIVRRSADYRVMLSGLLTFTFFILISGLALISKGSMASNLLVKYVLFHILSGGLLFGLTFMATDPVTSPYTRPGRLIFGLIIGGLVAVIRLFGSLPEGMVFALLIANAFVALIDYKKWTTNTYTKKFIFGYTVVILLVGLAVFAGMGGF